MITAFHLIASNNIDLTVDLTNDLSNRDVLEGYDMKTKINYSTASTKGIKWLAQGKEHLIYSAGMRIHGMVTPDFKKVVVIYPPGHPEFPSPHNAVVYNENGTVHLILACPEPISELIKKSTRYLRYRQQTKLYIVGAVWKRNEQGDVVMAVNIEFDDEYYETRELNYATGAFGACLSSGK
ncbi:hypothetical protein A4H97_30055 [Niastella yeongjuensis]|uniref:Uncharacterized protein n=1 Tax=Niastella yeongjuensis TaxID=354355 RepID=A0A1V9EPL0_9BACT|nr:hypothetical protein [Niastella yeongjuensis]OQP48079.1 hypothetical protein A4H97_30055 [Niastella yeongjuensis]SEO25915.1 hypothetical protein SAMN05660816_02412 [Niastella yeongjuensis]